jgi:hypothetical protein
VEADDYPSSQALISRLRRPGRATARTWEEVPADYDGFEIVEHRREIDAAYSPQCLAVKIREDDLASWALHGWLRSQLPRKPGAQPQAPGTATLSRPALPPPQYSWNLSKMPEHPMPVPPVFQPELAARAIAYLAEHPGRNYGSACPRHTPSWASGSRPGCSTGTSAGPGVKSQQTDRDLPRQGSNVYEPRGQTEDQGAHRAFDGQAHAADPQLWLSVHRRAVLAAAALAGRPRAVARRS